VQVVYLFHLPTGLREPSPAFLHLAAIPLRPTSLLSAEDLLPVEGGLVSLGSTRGNAFKTDLTACYGVLHCEAHPEVLSHISIDSPSLLMFLCSAERNACTNYNNMFFS